MVEPTPTTDGITE
jgi:tryptophanyl-tRNA synthetase